MHKADNNFMLLSSNSILRLFVYSDSNVKALNINEVLRYYNG